MKSPQAAVFLDRDGVVIEDRGLIVNADEIRIPEGTPSALRSLQDAGFRLVVVTNQSVVARGMLSEEQLQEMHREIQRRLTAAGGPLLDAIYYCPHHPEATLPEYRVVCECRKPRPGSLLRAAADLGLDLPRSFMIGDRPSDIAAGSAAGCRTVLLQTGCHKEPPIVTVGDWDRNCQPHCSCADLPAAAAWILSVR